MNFPHSKHLLQMLWLSPFVSRDLLGSFCRAYLTSKLSFLRHILQIYISSKLCVVKANYNFVLFKEKELISHFFVGEFSCDANT